MFNRRVNHVYLVLNTGIDTRITTTKGVSGIPITSADLESTLIFVIRCIFYTLNTVIVALHVFEV